MILFFSFNKETERKKEKLPRPMVSLDLVNASFLMVLVDTLLVSK